MGEIGEDAFVYGLMAGEAVREGFGGQDRETRETLYSMFGHTSNEIEIS